jgi:hypothetical protein
MLFWVACRVGEMMIELKKRTQSVAREFLVGACPALGEEIGQYVGVGTMTAGKIEASIVLDRADQIANVAGYWSGYPSSVVVPN